MEYDFLPRIFFLEDFSDEPSRGNVLVDDQVIDYLVKSLLIVLWFSGILIQCEMVRFRSSQYENTAHNTHESALIGLFIVDFYLGEKAWESVPEEELKRKIAKK